VDRVVSLVPMWIRTQLYDVDRVYTVAHKRFVIVAADPFFTIEKDLVVPELSSGLPDKVQEPRRARSVTTELKILVTHHVEQNQRRRIYQFISLFQQRYVATASVRVIGPVFVFTITPTLTKRLFAVEKHEPVRHLRFFFRTAEHSSHLEQRCDRRRRIIRTDEVHVFIKLRVVVTREQDRRLRFAGNLADDVGHLYFSLGSYGGELVERNR